MPSESTARRGTLRDEQKRATRQRIVGEARRLFAQEGYTAVRVDDIAAAVGCSRATFYLHFTGKPEVLRDIARDDTLTGVQSYYRDLDRVLSSNSRDEFADWVRRAIGWFVDNKELLPAWDEATALEPEFRDLARQGINQLADSMPEYLSRWPRARHDEARLRIELLVAQLERFFTRWAMQGTIEVTVDEAAEVLTEIWYPALRAPAS
ncbi:TetR/AcrR family transcriptional regulator [Nocardia vermiculata]|uniref:TetR/AcrR family transcriptional regulator n=1 Tax=Nocardia vermiculata TaxID=257274 RepID=A0A846Y028_9NOCA|nr:TetR/AcrR family transcriptional regulator [Nocardia vermiculata]NKY52207.1 TetR/AcrR family transcriptional regulator [Nocardia vermiculata]